jgi:IS30 family transposase
MAYKRLTIRDREIIFKGLAQGLQQKEIAKKLGKHPSAISREIRRDGKERESYSPSAAQEHATRQALLRRRKAKLEDGGSLAIAVEKMLQKRWSPEQIAGRQKREHPEDSLQQVSHETIYRYIYGHPNQEHRKLLVSCLRQRRKLRRKRRKSVEKRGCILNLVSIHERPAEVEDRQIPGHWEGDQVVGKHHKSALGTLVERSSRFVMVRRFVGGKGAEKVAAGFTEDFTPIPSELRRSMTYDRGKEMARHEQLTKDTGIPVFFADPHSPWQRGSNENTNGLIRDFLPKGTDFHLVSDAEVARIEGLLNQRPRKSLGFRSPVEALIWFRNHKGATLKELLDSKV